MTEAPSNDELDLKLIIDSDLMQDITDALLAFVDEARIQFLDELIRVWVVDPANAAATYIDLEVADWDQIKHYTVADESQLVGINLHTLDGYLDYAESGTPIQIEYGPAHDWYFNIQLPGVDARVAGIDPESIRKEPDKPTLTWGSHFDIPGADIKSAYGLNDMVAEHTTIRVDDHTVSFVASGDTDTNTFSRTEGESEIQFHQHPDEAVETMISLDYLKDMVPVLKGWDVRMKVGDERPVMFETDLFTMMLAPRIQKR